MKTEVKCTISGGKVIRTHTIFDDAGKLHSENTSIQGDRDIVLDQLEAQVAEAKRDRDGMLNPVTKPSPSDGAPGVEVVFWQDGKTLYRSEIRRDSKGTFQSLRTEPLGHRSQRLENAEERLAEITRERDAVKDAK